MGGKRVGEIETGISLRYISKGRKDETIGCSDDVSRTILMRLRYSAARISRDSSCITLAVFLLFLFFFKARKS